MNDFKKDPIDQLLEVEREVGKLKDELLLRRYSPKWKAA